MLLEPLKEALVAPPCVFLPSSEESAAVEELRKQADEIISRGEEWLKGLEKKIARARKHPDHRALFGKTVWGTLEPLLSSAIDSRESCVRQLDALSNRAASDGGPHGRALLKYARRLSSHVVKEHNALVDLYYMLKADADDDAEDTYGSGPELSSPDDVEAFFRSLNAA